MRERGPRFAVDDVRRHYAELAPTYQSRANAACARAYGDLVRHALGGSRRVLEIGPGATTLLSQLSAPLRVACDLSVPMLLAQPEPIGWWRVAGDAQALPFADATFDAAYAINVLEHVPDPVRVVTQAGRLLSAGGRFLAVTPNGDVEGLLHLLERLRLKIPEGPHRFLRSSELARLGGPVFRVLQQRRFLALPLGPGFFVRFVDRLIAGKGGRGLFQYVVLEKLAAAGGAGA
jgi:SAM-dependent methyltransferase